MSDKPPNRTRSEMLGVHKRQPTVEGQLLTATDVLDRPNVNLLGLQGVSITPLSMQSTSASVKTLALRINGVGLRLQAASNETLLETLRGRGNVEVKCGCEKGDCGACAVLVDGLAVDSCLTLTWTVEGCAITTIVGLGTMDDPHPLQKAFSEMGAAQCGYCTPGMIIAAQSMLTNDTDQPTLEEVKLGLSGNLCRCTGYTKIFDAVTVAAKELRNDRGGS